MTKRHLIIASRASPLALRQTEWVKQQLQKVHPHLSIDVLEIVTQADKMLNVPLSQIGTKGLFIKELENALFEHRADIAVHSMKDIPMDLPQGMVLPVICEREDARDVFIANQYRTLSQLPRAAVIGTSSLRRQTQLRALRSDVTIADLRGNINTRLNRLDKGDFDALILAAAGMKRMNFSHRIGSYLSLEECLPAAGQGALGIECREGDDAVIALVQPINHLATYHCVTAERAVCRHLEGGCMVPIAAFSDIHHDILSIRALVSNRDGTRILRAREQDEPNNADRIGTRVAEELLQQGAAKILKEFR